MQFTRLRLAGFKSFVDPTEILIEGGLTGIVGPNGCGKSNLVEALRWVMGETSAKGLRGGEMDDVIFAGTRGRPAYDLAEVAVQMRAGDVELPGLTDGDEIELVRRIARAAGSAYRVNGRDVRARDVQLLFADAASGARSASIVSQGQIGALVEAKPVDRRRLLEDAAGVAGLQARRHEAELKLQAAEANLARALDLIGELEEQCGRLRKQARQAKRYGELSATCREALAALLTARFVAARAGRDALEATLEAEERGLALASRRAERAREVRDQKSRELDLARTALAEAGAEQARLAERLEAAKRDVAREAEKQAALEARVADAGHDLAAAERELEDACRALERLRAEQAEIEAAVREGEASRAGVEARSREAEAEARLAEEGLRGQLDRTTALRTELRHQRDLAGQAAARCGELEAEIRRLTEALEALPQPAAGPDDDLLPAAERALADALSRADTSAGAAAEADHQVDSAGARLAEADRDLADRRERLQALEAERAAAEHTHARLSERLGELDGWLERLTARTSRLSARREDRERACESLGVARLRSEATVAEAHLEACRAEREQAAARLAEASARRDHVAADIGQTQEALRALGAELRALEELAPGEQGFAPVLDQIEVEDGFADALAAALGDDLLASLEPEAASRWQADGPAAGPALPEGALPLARYVQAPVALLGRLTQIGVVPDGATGERLRPALIQGQRLVSRDGGLWRWDGFVRRPQAVSQAATRVRQAHRRLELARERAERHQALEALEFSLIPHEEQLAACQTASETAEDALRDAQTALDGCLRARSEAEVAAASLASELEALEQEAQTVAAEQVEIVRERERILAELADLVTPPDDGAELAARLAEAETRRTAEAATHAAALEARAERRSEAERARRQMTDAQAELEQARERQRVADEAGRAGAAERERLAGEIARREELRDAALASEAAAREATQALGPDLEAAEAALHAAEDQAGQARKVLAEAADARLHDRLQALHSRRDTLAGEIQAWSERHASREARASELGERRAALADELAEASSRPAQGADLDAQLRAALIGAEQRLAEAGTARSQVEAELAEADRALEASERTRTGHREVIARQEAEFEAASNVLEQAARAMLERDLPRPPADHPVPDPAAIEELEDRLRRAETARERLGPVNLRAVDEAADAEMRLEVLTSERDELLAAIERLRRAIAALNREGRERLRQAFAAVERHFEALFVRLFGGGEARIALTDLEDPLAAGVELMVSPPGKKLQSVSLLSGGEKALTALALVFAVFLTRPSPLCVLDEVDAPLDDANVERLAALLDELAAGTETRFLVITHHPLTMARMHRLYGVTMLERGISRLVSVDLRAAEELRATA